METLKTLVSKFELDLSERNPIEIPNIGRRQFADLLKELNFNKGVEVGVAWGFYSEILMEANPDLELWGVDPYEPQKNYIDYKLKATFKDLETRAHAKLDRFPKYHFVRKTSMEALNNFADRSLDFVYLDGDHSFEAVANDIARWSEKVKKGGIISGHDYAHHARKGVKIHVMEAVKGYTDSYRVDPWFILGRNANNEGLIRDRIRSWFWVV